jgi:DNA-binding MarR family transcriptional regulator
MQALLSDIFLVTGRRDTDIFRVRIKFRRMQLSAQNQPRLIYLLNVAQRRLQRFAAQRSEGGGITPAQTGLLFVLGKEDGVLMGEAGQALDLGAAGISGLVDRMVAARLVERRADAADGRAWRIHLTVKGRAMLARAKAETAELNARLMEGFSREEIDIVARWLSSFQSKFPTGRDE